MIQTPINDSLPVSSCSVALLFRQLGETSPRASFSPAPVPRPAERWAAAPTTSTARGGGSGLCSSCSPVGTSPALPSPRWGRAVALSQLGAGLWPGLTTGMPRAQSRAALSSCHQQRGRGTSPEPPSTIPKGGDPAVAPCRTSAPLLCTAWSWEWDGAGWAVRGRAGAQPSFLSALLSLPPQGSPTCSISSARRLLNTRSCFSPAATRGSPMPAGLSWPSCSPSSTGEGSALLPEPSAELEATGPPQPARHLPPPRSVPWLVDHRLWGTASVGQVNAAWATGGICSWLRSQLPSWSLWCAQQ